MCVYSAIGGYQRDQWEKQFPQYPWQKPIPPDYQKAIDEYQRKYADQQRDKQVYPVPAVTQTQLADLQRQIDELRKLLEQAKQYDENTKQPHCEDADKKRILEKFIKDMTGMEIKLP